MPLARVSVLLAVLLAGVACTAAPLPASTPGPTATSGPTATTSPSPSASPTASPAGRVFTQADFTKSGGCGDVFMWAATEDDKLAVVLQWQGAATEAAETGAFQETSTLPDARVSVSLQVGQMLTAGFCTDILGMPGHQVDGEAPAVAGTVELTVRPTGEQQFPTANADLTLDGIVFDIVFGTEVEQWRIDRLELEDILVGWLAG